MPRAAGPGVHALAVAEVDGLLLGHVDDGKRPPRGIRRPDERGDDVETLEGGCLGDVERSDAGAPERREVPSGAERRAEVARERPHVGARRALDADIEVDPPLARAQCEELELRNGHPSSGELDRLALAHTLVGALAVDLDGAHGARDLLDLSGERRHRRSHRGLGDGRHRSGRRCRASASPSASSVVVAQPSRTVARYSLSRPTR